jgi:hypothetical protein
MHGHAKRPQGLRSGAALECPTGLGAKKDRALPIKLKIRVLIRESWCPNLDGPTQRKPAGASEMVIAAMDLVRLPTLALDEGFEPSRGAPVVVGQHHEMMGIDSSDTFSPLRGLELGTLA